MIKAIYSELQESAAAAKDIRNQLSGFDTKLLLYFASSNYNQDALATGMKEYFRTAEVFGCSTAGEIVSAMLLKNSVVAMAFDSGSIENVKIEVVENIKMQPDVGSAFASFENYFNMPISQLEYDKYVGIILIDGMTGAEETIMDQIGDKTNIIFIGASAGDDLKFKETYVYANGKSYTSAAVLALLKPAVEFDFIKTQSFKPLDKTLKATKVDEAAREIIEFNGKPAAEEYARSLDVSVEKASELFMHNPVGLMIGDEPYVRSPQQLSGSSVKFYCSVKEGMELSILESTDIIKDTTKAINDAVVKHGHISGIINFNCILRTLELEQKNLTKEYGEIFTYIPTIGFSTYGEEFIGHINQTSTMLVFK